MGESRAQIYGRVHGGLDEVLHSVQKKPCGNPWKKSLINLPVVPGCVYPKVSSKTTPPWAVSSEENDIFIDIESIDEMKCSRAIVGVAVVKWDQAIELLAR